MVVTNITEHCIAEEKENSEHAKTWKELAQDWLCLRELSKLSTQMESQRILIR